MDYKKKYEKLVDAVKVLRDNNPSAEAFQNWVSDNVPELKESEDKRWRNWLIGHLKGYINQTDDTYAEVCKKAIAWLERQGSQNLANSAKTCKDEQKSSWSEEDEKMLHKFLHKLEVCDLLSNKEILWAKNKLNHIQWKPSEEQMKLLREVQQALLGKDCHNRFVNFMYELKRLREE